MTRLDLLEFSTSSDESRRKHEQRLTNVNRRRGSDENRAFDRRTTFNIIISGHVAKRFGVNVAVDERCVVDADDEEGDAAEEPAATRRALFE